MADEEEPPEHDRLLGRVRRFRVDVDRARARIGILETALYLAVGLLLILAGGLILFDTAEGIVLAVTGDETAAEVGLRVLDRVLLLLIIAELLLTLQLVIARGEIATEPFLFIGIIAVVRRVVVITAEVENLPEGGRALTNFLLELGVLAFLVLAFGLAVYLLRRGAAAEYAAKIRSVSAPGEQPPVR